MSERFQNPETIPGTPVIREVRTGSGSENFKPVSARREGVRGEVDISPPLFGGRPFNLEDNNFEGVREFDIKRMKEQTVELEKDLIMKELETLDFLEALASTKSIVEDVKRQLQQQAMRCRETPEHLRSHIKEMIDERTHRNSHKSPDLTLIESKQACMNLGKTMDDLALIQSYAESLNMTTKQEKGFLGAASLAEELNSLKLKPQGPDQGERFNTEDLPVNPQCEQVKMVVETNDTPYHKQSKACLRTAEMRLVAARKMEEAARAAEALAIAEMTMLSGGKNQDALCFPEQPSIPLTLGAQMNKELSTNVSRIEILRRLEEANEEVKQSKQALEIAFNRVEIASVKQLEAEDAVRQWNIESWKDQKAIGPKGTTKRDSFSRRSFLSHVKQHEPRIYLTEPMLKRNVSTGNVLTRKQVPTIDDENQLVTPRRKFKFIHTHQASIGETV
ncbi:PREDICTED: WEB family protein At3g56270-like [Camelina sativa]|uniref:WEB family protein At3g56270-like n=1 Tax=Camelina sativa TaxID=90675 RepID=A0ABM0YQR8_CAMSA|nr:PREDICTED: WEB family protein At3g56270-like [Camelina sativa]